MIANEIIDAKVGSEQVTKIYLGQDLIWPATPITYVLVDTQLVYSTGVRLDAGVVGSQYTGNYLYATGTVRVMQGRVVIRTLYDEPLTLSVSSQDFHVLHEQGIDHDIIRGNNLGTTVTSEIKSAEVMVSYRGSTPESAGYVEQIINSYTEVPHEWTEYDPEPTIAPAPVPNTAWVTLYLGRYDDPAEARRCPAYGGTATFICYAGHNEADYSTTGWATLRTYTRTYTSGAEETSNPEIIAQGTTPPVQVGDAYSVDDTPTVSALPSWLHIEGETLRIDSEGTEPYANGRSATITASNLDVTPVSVTVYQQANVAEPDYIYETEFGDPYVTYDESGYAVTVGASAYRDVSSAAPASGGVYSNITVTAYHWITDVTHTPYEIYETPHWVWTSGSESWGTRHLVVEDEDVAYGTPRRATDSGLAPTITMSSSQGAQAFSWDGANSRVYIPTESVYEYASGRNGYVVFTNGDASDGVYLYQAKNVIESTDATPVRHWDSTTDIAKNDYDYSVDIIIFDYDSTNRVPAWGGVAGIGYAAVHTHHEVETQGYTDVVRPEYTWSSNAKSYGEVTSTRGSVTLRDETTQVSDTPTITVEQAASEWLTYESAYDRLRVESEGTTPYSSGRSAVITATNNGASDTATLYQAINRVESTSYSYDLDAEIQQTGNIPANGGTFYVTYRSFRTATQTYTSRSSKTLAAESYTSSVTGTNCTPSVNSVFGESAFSIDVGANSSTTSTRAIEVRISATSSQYVTATKVQDKASASATKVASLVPWMINMQGSPFTVGKVYYQFQIESGTLSSGTLTGVNFCWRYGEYGTKNTVQIGTFAASETSQPTALEPSGVNIPTFHAGDGRVLAWFEVTGSKGGFDTIHADENNYYFDITF